MLNNIKFLAALRHKRWFFPVMAAGCLLFVSALANAQLVNINDLHEDRPADMVLINANIHTMAAHQPRAQALAVIDGYIVDIGNNQRITSWIGQETQVMDAQGLFVLPGFIDTHNHVFEGASEVGGSCELSPDLTLLEQIPLLQACAELPSEQGAWITGYGHRLDTLLSEATTNTPREILDDIFPDNPIVIMEESSHSMMANSRALALAGFSSRSPHPQGGRITKDPKSGELNGILFDSAGDIVMELAWNSQSGVFNKSYDGLLAGLAEAAKHGITTIGDGRMYWQRGWYDVWQLVKKDGELTARVSLRPWIYPEVDRKKQLAYLQRIQSDDIDELLIVDQVKMYIDGVMHFGTAKVAKPYDWSWQEDAPRGLYYITPEALESWLPALQKIGYGAHIHAIGDLGITQAIDAIANVRTAGSQAHYGLTHLEMVRKSDFKRFARYGIDADFQAGASFFARHEWAVPYVGKRRAMNMLQMRGVYDAGANVTFSSDWTVNDLNPLMAIANSLRLKDKQGLPDIYSAMAAATLNGAKALGVETITGSLREGKAADFVILSNDITRSTPDTIEDTEVVTTVLLGDVVFDIED